MQENDLAKNRRYASVWALPAGGGPQATRQVSRAPQALTDREALFRARGGLPTGDGSRISLLGTGVLRHIKYVKNCTTPTLFISGAWDFITPVYQAEEMFVALKSLGIDAIHASYPNEGHGVRNQPRHTHDYYRRAVAWFDKYLKEFRLDTAFRY